MNTHRICGPNVATLNAALMFSLERMGLRDVAMEDDESEEEREVIASMSIGMALRFVLDLCVVFENALILRFAFELWLLLLLLLLPRDDGGSRGAGDEGAKAFAF